jgi:antitoxin (DNA-binding transcriptional repressor) of toxin-antitoxin stability system
MDLVAELGVARAALAAAKTRYQEAEQRVREVLGDLAEPGARTATYRGRPVARITAYTEERVNLTELRDSWPDVAATVTETHLRTRFTVELGEEAP